MKKVIAWLMVLVLLFSFGGCSKNEVLDSKPQQTESVKDNKKYRDTLTLIYSAADTFNPYDAKTETNRQLCKLLYEPLVKTDNNFKPHYSIASSVKTVKDVCTVILKNIKFSDGSRLTAKDVVYSYKLAKKSSTSYKNKLYGVDSVKAKDDNTVIFNLKKNDPYFENVLDFPIIKAKSEKRKDSDSVIFPPIGAGRYKVDESNVKLVLNKNYHGKQGNVKTINLINAPDSESISHYVEIGATDVYYSDVSDGTIFRMSGIKNNINLNNLVYIGINHKNKKLAVNELRQALSSGVNREAICKDAYYNNAYVATGFFNPLWEVTKSLQNIEKTSNSQITVENLEKIGYNDLDKDGIRRKSNNTLRFSLLVNKENAMRVAAARLIASQLKEYGIGITVVETSYKEYKKRLKKGNFDLYLGEVKITENMDLSELVFSGGSAAYGIVSDKNEKTEEEPKKEETKEKFGCAQVIEGFYKGKNSISDIAVTLQSDMPFIPVCYRTGVLFYNEKIENVKIASMSDIYFSIESYKIKPE